jgi:dCMP deaminase
MNPHKFIGIAKAVAAMSKDPNTQVGAIAVNDDGVILSVGYNGFPRGVLDLPERLCEWQTKINFSAHAEGNCIAQAARAGHRLHGSTLIVSGLFPCGECAKLIINAGIRKVIAPPPRDGSKWLQSNHLAIQMFNEAGVEVVCLSY